MFLMIDNYDSFVYNLVRYIEELGEHILVKRNDDICMDDIRQLKPKGIILSPGPKRPEDAGICLEIVRAFGGIIPILGICLGHQVIGHVYGGHVTKGKTPIHGKVSAVYHDQTGLYKGLSMPFYATRYHSLVVEETNLPACLEVTSRLEDGTIMGLRHKNNRVEGVQFHPEAELTEYGHELLHNFIKSCHG